MAVGFPGRAALEAALDLAARAPSPQNCQPWRWQVDSRGLHLYADWGRGGGASEADRRDVLLSCGALLDHCVVALAAAGWPMRVRRFPDLTDRGHVALFEIIEEPPLPTHRELADAIGRRRSDRRDFRGSRLPAGTLELLAVHAARRGVEFGVVPHARWTRDEHGDVALRFPAADAPNPTTDGAVLIVLGTERDDDPAQVRAGETLSHLLLAATAMELASCALTAPLRDPRSRLSLGCEVFDGEAFPQALIRVGENSPGDVGAATQRRTAEQTTTWTRT